MRLLILAIAIALTACGGGNDAPVSQQATPTLVVKP